MSDLENKFEEALKKAGVHYIRPLSNAKIICVFCGLGDVDFSINGDAFHLDCLRMERPPIYHIEYVDADTVCLTKK